MKQIHRFQGTLERGFTGNISYQFALPEQLTRIRLRLAYREPERIGPPDWEALKPIMDSYRPGWDETDLKGAAGGMKTEIQLALLINGHFIGNVHKPGRIKEMEVSKTAASDGALPAECLGGMAKVIINSFQVLEDGTVYELLIEGDF